MHSVNSIHFEFWTLVCFLGSHELCSLVGSKHSTQSTTRSQGEAWGSALHCVAKLEFRRSDALHTFFFCIILSIYNGLMDMLPHPKLKSICSWKRNNFYSRLFMWKAEYERGRMGMSSIYWFTSKMPAILKAGPGPRQEMSTPSTSPNG